MSHKPDYAYMQDEAVQALKAMRNIRAMADRLSEVSVRTGKIKAAAWTVDNALDKLAHMIFLHQKQTRRASGK